jgi:hypothetical protein
MAAPSLGYAIGLNVQGKDVFGKLGPQLSQNLANWSAKKERAAKEKEDKEEKYQQELYELSKEDYHIRVRGEAKKAYDDLRKKVNAMIESGEDSRKIMDTFIEYGDIVRGVRQKSKQLYDDQKAFVQNTNYIHPQVLDVIYNSDTPLNAEQVMEATIFGINSPDPQANNWLTVLAPKKPIVESVGQMKLSEDQAMVELSNQVAAKKKYDADIAARKNAGDKGPFPPFEQTYTSTSYKSQAIPGYTAPAGAVLTPGETFFIANVANTMLADEANVENALVEYQSKLPKGETLVSKIRAEMQLDPNLTLDQAKFNVARKYVVDNYYDSWASQNSKFMEYNKYTPSGGGGDKGKTKPDQVEGVSDITYQAHFSTAGFAKIKTGWKGDEGELYEMKKEGKLGQSSALIAGYGPTVEFAGGPTSETYSISGLGNINPVSLYYDVDSKEFRLSYNTTVSTSGMTVLADQKDEPLNKKQLNQIRGSLSAQFKKKIDAFDAALANEGFPTTLEAAGGGAPAGSASGGGKAKISGF